MKQINTKFLKSSLSLEDHKSVCKALGIPIFAENSNQIVYYTGDKNLDPYKGSPKLIFYKDTGVYVGYTAGRSYDLISLTQQRLSLLKQPSSFIDAINFILSTTGKQIDSVQRINKPQVYDWEKDLGKFIRFKRTGSILPTYNPTVLDQLETRFPQPWLDEGISEETMAKYQIGYYDRLNATTIPCFAQDGSLIGIRCRHWRPDEIEAGKYRPLSLLDGTTFKFPTNNVFFGINWNWVEIERTGHVILVEGEKSTLKADTWWGEKSNVLALYGSNLGLQRRNQLIKLGIDHITIAVDSDFHEIGDEEYDKFEKKVLALAKLFKGYAKVDVVYNNIGLDAYKASPFDFDEATYNLMWKNREVVE